MFITLNEKHFNGIFIEPFLLKKSIIKIYSDMQQRLRVDINGHQTMTKLMPTLNAFSITIDNSNDNVIKMKLVYIK